MKKYIDADKLIAEIERLQRRAEHYEEISLTDGERSYWSGENGALELLATFITSFHQEQQEVDLEKEIDAYLQDWEDDEEIGIHLSTDFGDMPIEVDDVRDLARHFFEIGLNARKEE